MKQILWNMTAASMLLALTPAAIAQTPMTPKAQYSADSKAATARYTSDKALCNDETTSAARLQCRRDAKAEYDKAMAEAKARLSAASSAPSTGTATLRRMWQGHRRSGHRKGG